MTIAPTGIPGLDAVLLGGLPSGRTTMIVGGPGSGKTVLAMQFLVNGILDFGEPGLMISFEESPDAIRANLSAPPWRMEAALTAGLRLVDGRVPVEAVEAGLFDLAGLVEVASSIIAAHGIKRVALDGIDALFALSDHPANRRRENHRILSWIVESHMTALLTMKADAIDQPSRDYFGMSEYAADGVIELRTRLFGELSRRTLSVIKMRGASFESGEHAYTISQRGLRVLRSPARTRVQTQALTTRLSTGVERLDGMMAGGYRAGTTTLISGLPGTSKTTFGAAFLKAGCDAGERCLFIGFDEPAEQMIVDVRSVGIDFTQALADGLLRAESFSAGALIGDEHFLMIEKLVDEHEPIRVVIDPITALEKSGGREVADSIMERLVVLLKSRGISAVITAISAAQGDDESTLTRVSTIADTWIHLSFANRGGERNRTLTIVKSRGTGHSKQMREVLLSSAGIDLADVYLSGGQVLVGTARAQSEQQADVDRAARDESDARELEQLERDAQNLTRQLQEAQRGLDHLAEYRLQVVQRAAVSGQAHEQEMDLNRSLRGGDADS